MENLFKIIPHILQVFFALSDDYKKWTLDYLCGGKGVIRYEKIKFYEDLDSVPEGEFYKMTEFYSSLKKEIMKPYILAENENEKAIGFQ